ncbi:MAG: protein translocase subunit SecD [SAR324 cluster bacterium]|uniref:Protein translocase subunit SecD n=1 Tax=SAR324 cluster bacterium TaxID=2024889 RepID=A0A2A4T1K7_9DELT|nr:MAG: protein translocase subunit SecD [SAR324 cluster bacterium]
MKIPWKGLAILGVLIVALIYNRPTLLTFLPEDTASSQQKLQARMEQIKAEHQQLIGLGLALAEGEKKRIMLIMDEGAVFPTDHPVLEKILDGNFFFEKSDEGSFLKLKDEDVKNVFVTKVSNQLNGVLTNARKVVEIGLTSDGIFFQMEKGKRISPESEPFITMLGDEFELSYQDGKDRYVTRKQVLANVVNLGLDLQGGMYLDIGVESEVVVQAVMDRVRDELEDKLIDDNINYDVVERIGDNQIEIVLDADEELDLTDESYTRLLELNYDVLPLDSGFLITLKEEERKRIKSKAIEQALETIRNRIDQLGVKEPSVQKQGDNSIIIQLPGLKDPDQARRVIGRVAVLNFMAVAENGSVDNPSEDQVVLYQENRDALTKELISTVPYLLEKKVLLKGDRIRDARVGFLQTGGAYVSMSFDEEGKELFSQITGDYTNRRMAIVLDGKVQSAPRINERISGGEAQITGGFSPEEASELALVLRSGALPAPIVIHEERTVGASLGEDSIRQALMSLSIGFAGVILFMLIYYRVSGLFSVMALIFNILLIVAALAYFGATLTLPGMAGIILTIGMAVDANVLIFERIREELARGTSVRAAIGTGFQKATITILDSNITTILAAIVLFQFGTGPIKGFAITLSIGIAASMFTSIVVGRFLFEVVYLRKAKLDKISI